MDQIIQASSMLLISLVLCKYVIGYDPIKMFRWDINLNGFKRMIGIKPKPHQDMTMNDVMGGMAPPDVEDQRVYEIPEEEAPNRYGTTLTISMDEEEDEKEETPYVEKTPKKKADVNISKDTMNRLDDFLDDM